MNEEDLRNSSADQSFGPITLFDAGGQAFEPVRQRNQEAGIEAFRIKPAGASNRAGEAIAERNIIKLARALLIEQLPFGLH
jgi:5-methylcytosine-specific restriction protein B